MRVMFFDDIRKSIKEDPKPCEIPTVIEIVELCFYESSHCVRFYDTKYREYVSTVAEEDKDKRDDILSELLGRGYADLTPYGVFVFQKGQYLSDYKDEDDETENVEVEDE